MEQEICLCEYCGNKIKNLPLSKSGHYRSCRKYRAFKKEIETLITKEYLQLEYIEKELSACAIAANLGLKKPTIVQDKILEYGFHVRTLAETRRTKGYIESTKETCRKKYNADYHTCSTSNKRDEINDGIRIYVNDEHRLSDAMEKMQNTVFNRFGVNFISQSKYWSNSVRQTCIERYGVDNPWKSQEIIESIKATKYANDKTRIYTFASKKANSLFDKLRSHIIDNEHIYCNVKGKEFGLRDSKTAKYYFYDFVDTQRKKCIEFNGNYWHANPLMYNETDVIKKGNRMAKEIWESDYIKLQRIETEGYDVLVIWESEYDDNVENTVKTCIDFLTN
jgi:G:T-mismatch repair DNA endonuclease (very short patch repair protein)